MQGIYNERVNASTRFLSSWGGTGTYVINLAKSFPKDYSIHIVTLKRKNFNNKFINSDLRRNLPHNIYIHYIGSANDTFFYNLNFQLNYRKSVRSLLENYDIDLIHSQSSMPDLFCFSKNRNTDSHNRSHDYRKSDKGY